jgi:uncharacterized membrane protein YedE/YeeE
MCDAKPRIFQYPSVGFDGVLKSLGVDVEGEVICEAMSGVLGDASSSLLEVSAFTPLESTLGGVLIGLAAGGLLLHHGRILGVSGMLHGLRDHVNSDDFRYRVVFLLGTASGALLATLPQLRVGVGNVLIASSSPGASDEMWASLSRVAIAGALVGAGTKVGHGCTSGHGVCGLGRLSTRSLLNVGAFLVTGVVTASLLYPRAAEFGVAPLRLPPSLAEFAVKAATAIAVPVALTNVAMHLNLVRVSQFVIGGTFGLGLAIGGMTNPAKVLGFLRVASGHWDPSLMCVLGGAVIISFLSYQIKNSRRAPLLAPRFQIPSKKELEPRLVGGGILFGVGWAIAGFCPGPVIANLPSLSVVPPLWIACALLGGWLAERIGF